MKRKKAEITENVINHDELRKLVQEAIGAPVPDKKEVFKPIVFDGKQYSVRIPKKFADAVNLKPGKDTIKFTLEPSVDRQGHPILKAELIQHGEATTKF